MVYLKKDRIVFVHIPRTSGTSIEKILGIDLDQSKWDKHLTASQIKNNIGDLAWKESFKFSIVRNPWERVVSLYNQKGFSSINALSNKSLFYFLKNYSQKEWENGYCCSDYIDEDLDFIAKLENRKNDLNFIENKIGKALNNNLYVRKSSPRKPWYFYYNERNFELVSKLFKKDIDRFHYDESFFFRKVFQKKRFIDLFRL